MLHCVIRPSGGQVSALSSKFSIPTNNYHRRSYHHLFLYILDLRLWHQLEPPPGKQRQLSKGNLGTNITNNHVDGLLVDLVEATKNRRRGGLFSFLKPVKSD